MFYCLDFLPASSLSSKGIRFTLFFLLLGLTFSAKTETLSAKTETLSAKTETLSEKTEKFSAKTEKFLAFGELF
jgi:hypothetical protein